MYPGPAGWDRESTEEYDDGYTRDSFERAEEDTWEDLQDKYDDDEAYDEEYDDD